eukprot:Em0002g1583a
MVQTVFKLLVHALAFASHAILARPDYNNAAFIPPGENFQDYLCGNGSLLHSNMTLVLGGGVHRIPPGPFCFVSNVSNILITGSSSNVTIRCEGERGFGFIAVRNLTIERVTIVGCGQTDTRISQTQEDQTVPVVFYFERSFDICIRQMKLTSFRGFGAYGYALNKASMSEVVFEGCAINASCSAGLFSQVDSCWDAVQLQPQEMTLIVQSCTYRSLSGVAESFSAGLSLCGCVNATILDSAFDGLEGTSISATDANVSIENSTFVGNRATDIIMEDSNTSVSRCRFNGHGDEAISITSTGSVATYIADSVFQNYEINVLDVFIGTGDTRVTNCTFQDNGEYTITLVNGRPLAAPRDNYGGPMACTVQLSKCTFTRNRPGKVRIAINDDAASIMNCSTVITDCKFYRNRAFINDVIMPIRSLLNVDIAFAAERDVTIHITDSIFKENTDVGGITIGSFMHVQVYISRCIFEKNIRGQSIYYLFIYEIGRGDVPVSFAVTDCTFMNNTLDDYRGVGISVEQRVMAWQMNVVVTGCTFQGNYGGAVYLVNVFGNIEIENCNFIENNADTSGSGLAIVVDHQIKSNVLVSSTPELKEVTIKILVCDSVNGTVARKGTNWIGLYTNKAQSVPALVITCPLNYCKSNFTHLSLQSIEEDICNGGRTGILCGHCYENYSVVFGSPGCQVCSDMWLISLALYAILGASLVAILFILNLTVTQGTLYGFIFYANIIQVNTSIFFNQSVLVPLQTGLQFVFPAYLLTLTITVIVVCHYFLSRPTHQSSSRRCLGRLSYLVGQRAVGVLSTLIYLSYSKLLRTVVDVFLYSTLYLPEGSILIWFYDGNIKYLHGKHLVLFVVAMVICILFLIPYTLALTFIPIIEHFSEHNRVFHCLSMMVNRVKPMNDAHYAPYKGEWRWWLGARLWFLVFMYALNPVYSSENPSLLLLIHGSTMIFFISVQGYFQPFGVQMPANYSRSISILNACYNWLDLFSLINYAILAHSVSYILDHDSDPVQMNVAIGVLIGTFGAVFLTAVLFHVIVAFLKVCNMYDTVKQKIHNHVSVEHTHSSATVELQRPTNTAVINTDYCAIREPLLLEEI